MPRETNTDKRTLNGRTSGSPDSPLGRAKRVQDVEKATPIMRLLAYLYLLCQSGALFTIPPAEQIYDVIITPLAPSSETVTATVAHPTFTQYEKPLTFTRSNTRLSESTSYAMAPLSRNALELRQKYMNDQGLGVDCRTWTKYQYTRVIQVSSLF